MRILILSDITSVHTEKWVKGLCQTGIEVGLFSLSKPVTEWYEGLANFTLCYTPQEEKDAGRLSTKLGYLSKINKLKRCIREFKPEIVHAHYATSYGLLGRLSGFRPYVISVWGADIYDFPKDAPVKRALLRHILNGADIICSTSNSMGVETKKYTDRPIQTIPFGINSDEFACKRRAVLDLKNEIVIGCIKSLTPKYGTNYLIEAFARVADERKDVSLSLLLVGGGSHLEHYKRQAEELGISEKVVFTGNVSLSEVPRYHCKIDVFVSLSVLDSESFGVSLVEAMASGSHIVATKVSGFKEVLMDSNEFGLMISPRSVDEARTAILDILENREEAFHRSEKALISVKERYEWKHNLSTMCMIYNDLMPYKE